MHSFGPDWIGILENRDGFFASNWVAEQGHVSHGGALGIRSRNEARHGALVKLVNQDLHDQKVTPVEVILGMLVGIDVFHVEIHDSSALFVVAF